MSGPDHPRGPAGLPMPPNMAHLMFHGPLLPHSQPPSSGELLRSCLSPAVCLLPLGAMTQCIIDRWKAASTCSLTYTLQGLLAAAKTSAAPVRASRWPMESGPDR